MLDHSISQYQPSLSSTPPPTTPASVSPPLLNSPPPPPVVVQPKSGKSSTYLTPAIENDTLPPATGHPRSVVNVAPAASTLGHMTQRISQEFQETPYIDLQPLKQNSSVLSWRTAVIIGVAAFFLGAFLSLVAMFWLY